MDQTMNFRSVKNSLSVMQAICYRANGGDWDKSLSWVIARDVTHETLGRCFDSPCRPRELDLKIEAVVGWWVMNRPDPESTTIEPVAGPYKTDLEAADALAGLLRQGSVAEQRETT